ncbi:MAG TPA: hypothetical protein DCG34_03865 [Clostridiales bacterium]|jgi:hypothetical protein|nr:hypothetical protein [Clostridiales bacterium]
MRKRINGWNLVTPEEAIKLSGVGTVEHIRIAAKIAQESISREVKDLISMDEEIRDFKWAQLKVWATVWNAGRIAGIRYERMKRRKGTS